MAGPVFFILLVVYGLLNNMSMSYMGNRNETIEGFIIDNFLGHIIVFLLKTLSVYLVIGFVFGIAAEIMLLNESACVAEQH